MLHSQLQATPPSIRTGTHGIVRAAAEADESVAEELLRSAGRAERRGGVAASAAFWEQAVALTVDPGDPHVTGSHRHGGKIRSPHFASTQRLLVTAEIGPLDGLGRGRPCNGSAQHRYAYQRGNDRAIASPSCRATTRGFGPRSRETYLQALVARSMRSIQQRRRQSRDSTSRDVRFPPNAVRLALATPSPRPRPPSERRVHRHGASAQRHSGSTGFSPRISGGSGQPTTWSPWTSRTTTHGSIFTAKQRELHAAAAPSVGCPSHLTTSPRPTSKQANSPGPPHSSTRRSGSIPGSERPRCQCSFRHW